MSMGAILHPRGLIGRIYVSDHYILLHTNYTSCGPHGFRKIFFMFSHYKPKGVIGMKFYFLVFIDL